MRFLFIACALLSLSCADPTSDGDHRPSDLRRSPSGNSEETSGAILETKQNTSHGKPERVRALSSGQTLYVPVYSHVYHGPRARQFNLACMLSVRNTDMSHEIIVAAVDYYDTSGKLVGHYLEGEQALASLETTEFFIEERDVAGGSGANFVVRWRSAKPVNPPVVEALMIGVNEGQGISFLSRAQEIFK